MSIGKLIGTTLLNGDLRTPEDLSVRTEIPIKVVRHILSWFEAQGLLDVRHAHGGHMVVSLIHPELKRSLSD